VSGGRLRCSMNRSGQPLISVNSAIIPLPVPLVRHERPSPQANDQALQTEIVNSSSRDQNLATGRPAAGATVADHLCPVALSHRQKEGPIRKSRTKPRKVQVCPVLGRAECFTRKTPSGQLRRLFSSTLQMRRRTPEGRRSRTRSFKTGTLGRVAPEPSVITNLSHLVVAIASVQPLPQSCQPTVDAGVVSHDWSVANMVH
jgi:hypothetical protein